MGGVVGKRRNTVTPMANHPKAAQTEGDHAPASGEEVDETQECTSISQSDTAASRSGTVYANLPNDSRGTLLISHWQHSSLLTLVRKLESGKRVSEDDLQKGRQALNSVEPLNPGSKVMSFENLSLQAFLSGTLGVNEDSARRVRALQKGRDKDTHDHSVFKRRSAESFALNKNYSDNDYGRDQGHLKARRIYGRGSAMINHEGEEMVDLESTMRTRHSLAEGELKMALRPCWESAGAKELKMLVHAAGSRDLDTLWFCSNVDRPLAMLAGYLIDSLGIIDVLSLDALRLERFLIAINDSYADPPSPSRLTREDAASYSGSMEIPYHNRAHAVDVLQGTYLLLTEGGIAKRLELSPLEILAVLIAAAVHDVEHPGKSNEFHKATWNSWAIFYNDRSINENHHAAKTFELLLEDDKNWLSDLEAEERNRFRELVVDLVLATDFSRHFEILRDFLRSLKHGDDDGKKYSSLQMLVKTADLRHCFHEWNIHKVWTNLLEAEMWLQGDKEKNMGIKVGPFNDRDNPKLQSSQAGFFRVMVLDSIRDFCNKFPECHQLLMSPAETNLEHWRALEQSS